MTPRTAVLLVAHGERSPGATNAGVWRLVDELRPQVAAPVGAAFLSGAPGVPDALRALAAPRVLIYPLFLSDGYFSQVRLPALVAEAHSPARVIETMTPLGLDPNLVGLVEAMALREAARRGLTAEASTVMLLAHGSTKDAASRNATQTLAERLAARAAFRRVATAFLDESPVLAEAVRGDSGPVIVVGLFAGEGLHGGGDAPRLIAELDRDDVTFAGNIGAERGLAALIATSIAARLAVVEASTDAPVSV